MIILLSRLKMLCGALPGRLRRFSSWALMQCGATLPWALLMTVAEMYTAELLGIEDGIKTMTSSYIGWRTTAGNPVLTNVAHFKIDFGRLKIIIFEYNFVGMLTKVYIFEI